MKDKWNQYFSPIDITNYNMLGFIADPDVNDEKLLFMKLNGNWMKSKRTKKKVRLLLSSLNRSAYGIGKRVCMACSETFEHCAHYIEMRTEPDLKRKWNIHMYVVRCTPKTKNILSLNASMVFDGIFATNSNRTLCCKWKWKKGKICWNWFWFECHKRFLLSLFVFQDMFIEQCWAHHKPNTGKWFEIQMKRKEIKWKNEKIHKNSNKWAVNTTSQRCCTIRL